MDTISTYVMDKATQVVRAVAILPIIHTVTITLNGQHGGADVTIEGSDFEDDPVTIVRQVH